MSCSPLESLLLMTGLAGLTDPAIPYASMNVVDTWLCGRAGSRLTP